MRVLMLGWEFPPQNEGGLGTACYGLTKGLTNNEVDITLVLPQISEKFADFKVIDLKNIKKVVVDSCLVPYVTSTKYVRNKSIYGKNLFEEVERYAKSVAKVAKKEKFDLIHAHDWLTFKAGVETKKISGKPLIVHVHATEYDRTGGNGLNPEVYEIEKNGLENADRIIAVSNYTKKMLVDRYDAKADKITVVHNAIEVKQQHERKNRLKTVLFLGRITLQKGPDYFLSAAKRVLDYDSSIRFIIAGSGDMEPELIEKAAELGIGDKVLFAGFLRGSEVDKAYGLADVYVMPSVSEPFGIAPLEAAANGTPCIISKNSGVSEVFSNCIKIDFWDIDSIASNIISVLYDPVLNEEMSLNALNEIKKMSWNEQAQKCIELYNEVV